jgi:hypothetical protein
MYCVTMACTDTLAAYAVLPGEIKHVMGTGGDTDATTLQMRLPQSTKQPLHQQLLVCSAAKVVNPQPASIGQLQHHTCKSNA